MVYQLSMVTSRLADSWFSVLVVGPCHQDVETTGSYKSKALPVFYAFTGYDTVSAFATRGKKIAWDTWNADDMTTEAKSPQLKMYWWQQTGVGWTQAFGDHCGQLFHHPWTLKLWLQERLPVGTANVKSFLKVNGSVSLWRSLWRRLKNRFNNNNKTIKQTCF